MVDPNRRANVKVLMITVRADVGGGPEHVFQLAQELNNSICIYIASPTDQPYWDKFFSLVGREKIVEIPHRKLSMRALYKLHRYISDNNISIVHSHGKGAGIYSRILKIFNPKLRIVHTLHGYHDGQYSYMGKKAYALIENILGRLTNKVINVSDGERKKFLSSANVAPEKSLVICNGVKVKPTLKKESIKKENGILKICYLARDDDQKNISEMVNIFNEFIKKHGDGAIKIDVYGILNTETYSSFGKGICYKGAKDEVRNVFNEYNLLLNTSRWEGMPISVLEAMAEGVIVVATDVVGNNDIITNGETGYLYPLGNVSFACNLLEKIFIGSNEVEKIREKAFNVIKEKYSIGRMSKDVLSIYEEIK